MAVRRVKESDMTKLVQISNIDDVTSADLGNANKEAEDHHRIIQCKDIIYASVTLLQWSVADFIIEKLLFNHRWFHDVKM